MKIKHTIFFDVQELYYLPQYLPIFYELEKIDNVKVKFIFYKNNFDKIKEEIINNRKLSSKWVASRKEAAKFYTNEKPSWIIFGNSFPYLDKIHNKSKTAQIGHGIGPKKVYYTQSNTPTTVRFVESEYRFNRLKKMFPKERFLKVGYCKLDPLINNAVNEIDIKDLNLNPLKKTILYAPTFYPSSLECFSKSLPKDFGEYNIILKPHYFSLSKKKYFNHRKILNYWSTFDNVYLADAKDYSIIPFLKLGDIMISDTSSAMIEFAALNKPVICCTFLKLRWNYRGIFSFRFHNRMDKDYSEYKNFTFEAKSYKEMLEKTNELLTNDFTLSQKNQNYIKKFSGTIDGNASKRIVTYLIKND